MTRIVKGCIIHPPKPAKKAKKVKKEKK